MKLSGKGRTKERLFQMRECIFSNSFSTMSGAGQNLQQVHQEGSFCKTLQI